MRRLARHFLRSLQGGLAQRWMREVSPDQIARSAVIFSPHPDDETLGCGGTVIKKRSAGASVKIAFMTDGRTSHGHLMPADRLTALRVKEAISAARILGMDESDVCFLGFPDSRLRDHEAAAIEKVREILNAYGPEQVFIPYRRDSTADHVATHRIVSAALARRPVPVTVYEYPIWFWHHWPWVPVLARREGLRVLRDSLSVGFGLRLLCTFRDYVPIADVLSRKRTALEQHASQMTRLLPDPRWKTLHDVAGGEFLKCFFQPWEVFCCYRAGDK